jgi:hypothetical protein
MFIIDRHFVIFASIAFLREQNKPSKVIGLKTATGNLER